MKKNLLLSIVALCMFVVSAHATGETLIPRGCNIYRYIYRSINEVCLTFGGSVVVADNATAVITCNGETVATGKMTAQDGGREFSDGIAIITFDHLILPKGKSYRLQISEGAYYSKDFPTRKTEKVDYDFDIPEFLVSNDCTIKNGTRVAAADHFCFYYPAETEPIGQPMMTLYREGVAVRTYAADVTWDWDLGQAQVHFGKDMVFEDSVHYSVVLPAGSLRAWERNDITNAETRVDFIGGYTQPVEQIAYDWCSLYEQHDTLDVLNEVRFYYKRAIKLAADPKVRLLNVRNEIIKEVTPVLSQNKSIWILSCDFGGVKVPEGGCCIVIPEGTIISADGRVAVNAQSNFSVNVSDGVSKTIGRSIEVRASERSIVVDNAPIGKPIAVYAADGRLVARLAASSRHFSVVLPSPGIYIVAVGGRTYKVALQR